MIAANILNASSSPFTSRIPLWLFTYTIKKKLERLTRFLVRFPLLSVHSLPCCLLSEKERGNFCPLLNTEFAVRAWSRAQGNGCVVFCFSSSESGSQPVWLTGLETHHRVQKGDYMEIIWISRVSRLICNQTILLEEPPQNFQWFLSMFLKCFTMPLKPWGEKSVIWWEKSYLYWWITRFNEPNLLICRPVGVSDQLNLSGQWAIASPTQSRCMHGVGYKLLC